MSDAYQKTGKAEKAREYRREYGMRMSAAALARIMYRENPVLFKDSEDARFSLRYIEGKTGQTMLNASPKSVKESEFYKAAARSSAAYGLPRSDAKGIDPFVIKGYKRALLLMDLHIPYQDNGAIATCFDYALKNPPDIIILNGDIVDCHMLSRFVKDPGARDFEDELGLLQEFIESVNNTFKCRIVYKIGNHEARYQHFMQTRAREVADMPEFDVVSVLAKRIGESDILEDHRMIMLNDLPLLHGHEFGHSVFNPVNTARGLYLRAKTSAVQGHSHKTSEHTETDLHGTIKTTWSVGCLCGLKPRYAPYNSWNSGFATVDLSEDGIAYEMQNKRIYRGKVI